MFANTVTTRLVRLLQTNPMGKKRKHTQHFLREWREYRLMTQEQLADRLGTTKGVISLLESGERGLSDKWLRRLGAALDVRPGWILDYTPETLNTSVLEVWGEIPNDMHDQAIKVLQTFMKKAS